MERGEGWPSEVFDLEAHPHESRNLIADPQYAKQKAALHAELTAYFSGHGAPPIDKLARDNQTASTFGKRPVRAGPFAVAGLPLVTLTLSAPCSE